jgi:hypothetical protein
MSTESIMFRLRRANPMAEAPGVDDSELLFARITALPADSRLDSRGRRRGDHRRRVLVVALVLALAALLASTAFAVSHWISGDLVRPPVTKREYLDAQKELTLPPGVKWPAFPMPDANSVTTRGGGGGHAVSIAQNAWECYWVRAIRKGDTAAEQRAHDELNRLLAHNILVAPLGAPEDWTPTPPPTVPFVVFANDGGLEWVKAMYKQAAAGDARNLAQSCRVNAPR